MVVTQRRYSKLQIEVTSLLYCGIRIGEIRTQPLLPPAAFEASELESMRDRPQLGSLVWSGTTHTVGPLPYPFRDSSDYVLEPSQRHPYSVTTISPFHPPKTQAQLIADALMLDSEVFPPNINLEGVDLNGYVDPATYRGLAIAVRTRKVERWLRMERWRWSGIQRACV